MRASVASRLAYLEESEAFKTDDRYRKRVHHHDKHDEPNVVRDVGCDQVSGTDGESRDRQHEQGELAGWRESFHQVSLAADDADGRR